MAILTVIGADGIASYSVAEGKDKLPALLNAVERGEAVTITRRGKPVDNLTPVSPPPTVEPEHG